MPRRQGGLWIGVRDCKRPENHILERNDCKVQVSSKQGQVGSLRLVCLCCRWSLAEILIWTWLILVACELWCARAGAYLEPDLTNIYTYHVSFRSPSPEMRNVSWCTQYKEFATRAGCQIGQFPNWPVFNRSSVKRSKKCWFTLFGEYRRRLISGTRTVHDILECMDMLTILLEDVSSIVILHLVLILQDHEDLERAAWIWGGLVETCWKSAGPGRNELQTARLLHWRTCVIPIV